MKDNKKGEEEMEDNNAIVQSVKLSGELRLVLKN